MSKAKKKRGTKKDSQKSLQNNSKKLRKVQEFVIVNGEKIAVKDNELILSNKNISSITEIKGLKKLGNLTKLDPQNNKITEITGLTRLTNLKELNLGNDYRIRLFGGNQISEINGFETLTNLEILNLSNNRIREIKGLETLINLRELDLSGNQLDEIKGLDHLTNLEHLNLMASEISDIKGLEKLINLKELELGLNAIDEIKGLDNLTNLEDLELEGLLITEIKGLENLKNLQELYLGDNFELQESEQKYARRFIGKEILEILQLCQAKAIKEMERQKIKTEILHLTEELKNDSLSSYIDIIGELTNQMQEKRGIYVILSTILDIRKELGYDKENDEVDKDEEEEEIELIDGEYIINYLSDSIGFGNWEFLIRLLDKTEREDLVKLEDPYGCTLTEKGLEYFKKWNIINGKIIDKIPLQFFKCPRCNLDLTDYKFSEHHQRED